MSENQPGAIAVVDDDIAVLKSYRFMLEMAGFHVATYASALDYLGASDSSMCMILDHNMPRMTGLELAAALRNRATPIPIMLVTSAPTPVIVARAAELGIVKVLEKPPDEDELINFVLASRSAR